jgi:hypothetical protein
MPKAKDTGLASFTETPAVEEKKAPTRRPKGQGKWVHGQMRMTVEQWELATQFAFSERKSLNQLALLGISKLREEKGLPPLPDIE